MEKDEELTDTTIFHRENIQNPNIEKLKNATEIQQMAYILAHIRNKYAHNELPCPNFWKFCQSLWCYHSGTYPSYSHYYADVFNKAAERLLQQLD